MKPVNIIVTKDIGKECLEQINNLSPRIKLTDATDLLHAEQSKDSAAKEKLDTLLAAVEVIYGNGLPQNLIARAPKLKWIQVTSAGANRFLDKDMVESPVILTNTSGIHAIPISEFVLGLMLMFVKQVPFLFQTKQEKQWKRFPSAVLRSKTVGIIGLGSIGKEVARLAKAFGMRVLAIRRSAKTAGRARYVDVLLPQNQLRPLLEESDFVVLSPPLTPETANLIGEKELQTMKPTAYLINIARGGIVDEEALIHAIEDKWIAGAGLDVFATEPLPADSKLWELPNLVLSPHISGSMEGYNQQANKVFLENLTRYLNGNKLFNMVNKKKGY
ncbi:D-2-hydroxyacid dehydrogenase [Chloroflexota bacterium]